MRSSMIAMTTADDTQSFSALSAMIWDESPLEDLLAFDRVQTDLLSFVGRFCLCLWQKEIHFLLKIVHSPDAKQRIIIQNSIVH